MPWLYEDDWKKLSQAVSKSLVPWLGILIIRHMKTVKETHNSVEHRHRKRHVSARVQAIAMFPWETCRIILNTIRGQSQCESA